MSSEDAKIVLEAFDDKFATLLENLEGVIDRKLQPIKDDTGELKDDMSAVKAAIGDLSRQVRGHEERIVDLEPQAV